MNTTETLTYIRGIKKSVEGKQAKKLDILSKVIKEIAEKEIPFYAEITESKNLRFYLAGTREPSRIRVAIVDGIKPEHPNGFERFNIAKGTGKCAFIIFAIEHSDNLITYIFRGHQIENVKSLNLRFTDTAKHKIVRKSKYDYALNNWSIIR